MLCYRLNREELLMQKDIQDVVKQYREYIEKIEHYHHAVDILYWDLRTKTPKKGMEQRAEVIGTLSTEIFQMTVSNEMEKYLECLSEPSVLKTIDEITLKSVLEYKKEFERSRKIPKEMYKEYVILTSKAEEVWEDAKQNNDFESFKPYLEKIVEFTKKFIELWGYEGHPYNALLDQYEPGMTVEILDTVFEELKQSTVAILNRITNSNKRIQDQFFTGHFEKEKQKAFGEYLLKYIGFDFAAGCLDESVHPFTGGPHSGDIRVTTNYLLEDMRSSTFSCIHEGGHGIYEQNISLELLGTNLCTGTSMGIHESQSRFFENMIGRSFGFWKGIYPKVKEFFPGQFDNVSVEAFFTGINQVQPSLIRVEADELTYNLHIILRYEIEKGLFDGRYNVSELPTIWKERMKEYLGVVPETDAEGVLQDTHWSGGAFGYFPSYSLGNIYAAQFAEAMKKEIGDYEILVEKGEFKPILEWLKQRIHRFGKLKTPLEILKEATGQEMDASYLIEYFERKYREIYDI